MAINMEKLLSMSLPDIRKFLFTKEKFVPDGLIDALENDSRKGARQIAAIIRRRASKNLREEQRLEHLLQYERELWSKGVRFIAGIDEAGMAPLAGPVVAGAVILPQDYKLPGLNDSKKIVNSRKRETLALQIKRDAVSWATGSAEVEEIDKLNIYRAGLLAMRRAAEKLSIKPEYLLVDARNIPGLPWPQRAIVKGDALSVSIAAASIIAKTTRDAFMIEMERKYPGYGFASHKGYPTHEHLRVLKEQGALSVHRRSFAPVRAALGVDPKQAELFMEP
jgi:ribonuclease HII